MIVITVTSVFGRSSVQSFNFSALMLRACGDLNNQENKVDDSFVKDKDIVSCLFFLCVNSHHRLDESSFRHGPYL